MVKIDIDQHVPNEDIFNEYIKVSSHSILIFLFVLKLNENYFTRREKKMKDSN